MTTDTVRILGVREAAVLLGVHPNTAASWLRDGLIPGRKVRGRWLIPEAALISFLKGGRDGVDR